MESTDVVHQRLNQERNAVSCGRTLGIEVVKILLGAIDSQKNLDNLLETDEKKISET